MIRRFQDYTRHPHFSMFDLWVILAAGILFVAAGK